ncbi:TetR family transcriptional regulator [Pseudosulfitobacter sp. SM2401]|uniref:TetR/AcrR family transcriptional regulator n=1 Tax=Pseudosulfitobacter sp. SM2401 TaxID=3350098 RepID=UPI0036F1E063
MSRAHPYNRETAIDAALTIFWKKGYHATSLKDLEGALNMKPGSIYAAFSSKETLFGLALERYFDTSRSDFLASVHAAPSPLVGLTRFVQKLGRTADDDTQSRACMLVKTVLNATQLDQAMSAQAERYLSSMEDEMRWFLSKQSQRANCQKGPTPAASHADINRA